MSRFVNGCWRLSFTVWTLLAGQVLSQSAVSANSVTATAAAAAGANAVLLPEGADVETVPPDTSREIVKRFRLDNPGYREHALGKLSDTYEDQTPGLRLERVFVGTNGTLLEITGLRRPSSSVSAVIRKDTLFIHESGGAMKALQSFDGVTELRDRKGGSALVVRPGETLYALFPPINDLQPFSLEHFSRDSKQFVYFEKLDPRFRERYNQAFAAANQTGATPEQQKDFLVGFARNDPDRRAPGIFLKLIGQMRAQNSFEGYYSAYLLLQDPQDAKAATKLVKTDQHRRMMENVAVASLVDKSRLLAMDLQVNSNATRNTEGGCIWFCRYNFSTFRKVNGAVTIKANVPGSPIKLKLGTYRVNLTASVVLPREKQRRSNTIWQSNFDGRDDQEVSKDFVVTLSPPNYVVTLPIDLGEVNLAFFERGSAGGYTAAWAAGDAAFTVTYRSVELAD